MCRTISELIGAHVKATDMLSPNAKGDLLMGTVHYNWNNWADLLIRIKELKFWQHTIISFTKDKLQ
jgi:beta-galactosidase